MTQSNFQGRQGHITMKWVGRGVGGGGGDMFSSANSI